MCELTKLDRQRKDELKRKVAAREEKRVDRKGLKWFGHIERVSAEWLPKKWMRLRSKVKGIDTVLAHLAQRHQKGVL